MDAMSAYKEIQSLSENEIVKKYAPLVKRIAYHMCGRLPNDVSADDMIQSGMIGLLEASKNFDPSKGANFQTFATFRIRGSMLDEVRRNDWVPRSVYRNSRMISDATRKVENRVGRDARDSEIAKELEIDLDEYYKLLQETSMTHIYGYEDTGLDDDNMANGIGNRSPDPLEMTSEQDYKDRMIDAMKTLPEREQLVLSLYYQEELNLKEIGEILGVSESRVCQINNQAVARLKARIHSEE